MIYLSTIQDEFYKILRLELKKTKKHVNKFHSCLHLLLPKTWIKKHKVAHKVQILLIAFQQHLIVTSIVITKKLTPILFKRQAIFEMEQDNKLNSIVSKHFLKIISKIYFS